MKREVSEPLFDLDRPFPCSTFWRDHTACPITRGPMYNGGHVCTVPSSRTLRHDDHRCACSHVWELAKAIREMQDAQTGERP